MFPKRLGRLLVEQTGFFEGFESIGVEHFTPDVAVIPRGITAGEDVPEIRTVVSRDDLREKTDFIHGGFLKF